VQLRRAKVDPFLAARMSDAHPLQEAAVVAALRDERQMTLDSAWVTLRDEA
jgi:hypothetical protein